MIGGTEGRFAGKNYTQGYDNFLITVDEDLSLNYLQWGTEYDDTALQAVVNFKSNCIYIAGIIGPQEPAHFVSVIDIADFSRKFYFVSI